MSDDRLDEDDLTVPPPDAGRVQELIERHDPHHPDCDKHWRTAFGKLVETNACPTCRALRDDTHQEIYDLDTLEQLYAPDRWTCRERCRDDTADVSREP